MLTLFSIPKAFQGHINIIQRNAIQSWKKIHADIEIVLFGDEFGTQEICEDFGIIHNKNIELNSQGTPLIGSAFDIIQRISSNNIIIFVNTDIIFIDNPLTAIRNVNFLSFLICGRRWDVDVNYVINYEENNWQDKLKAVSNQMGKLHGNSGIDYFIFKKGSINMPLFAVGRPGWDSWLIYHMHLKNIPVIDATNVLTIIHQNHDYSHSKYGEKKRVAGPELKQNIELAGGYNNLMTLRNADWILDTKSESPKYRPLSKLSLLYPWRQFLSLKRLILNKFGIDGWF